MTRQAGNQRGAVDRPRRGAHDQIEAVGQAQALQSGGHPGRDHPSHAATLDREGDAVGIAAPARLRASLVTLAEHIHHGMCENGSLGWVEVHAVRMVSTAAMEGMR